MMNKFKQSLMIGLLGFFTLGLVSCGGGATKIATQHKSGKLVSSKLLVNYNKNAVQITGIDSQYAVNVYRLVYETKDANGEFIDASGLVSIPQKTAQAKSPTLLYHHGTIYQNKYAPTNNVHPDSSWVLPAYIGFIAVSPDYIGYGESHGVLHPYVNAKVTASTSVDLLRAAQTLFAEQNITTNKQLFLGGYSQGGGAAMASHHLIETELADEFTVTATSAGAGSYAISKELLESTQTILDNYETYHIVRPSNIGFVLKAMDDNNHLNLLNDIFQEEYASVVDTIYDQTHSAIFIDSQLSHNPSELFKKEFLQRLLNGEEDALLNAFKQNDVYDWSPKAPLSLYHGKDDDWVPFSHSQLTYDTMRARGVDNIELIECNAGANQITNHANCFVPYLFSSYEFYLRYARDL